MPNNIFISGLPKSGKTTLIKELVKRLREEGFRVGGFFSPEEKHHGTREGFLVQDIETGKTARLAHVSLPTPKVGKYGVDVKGFEEFVLPILKNAKKYDAVVIDEIGRMELLSNEFGDKLPELLQSDTAVIATLHRDFVETYEIFGKLYMLTQSNHGATLATVLRELQRSLKKKPATKIKKARKKVVKRVKKNS